MRCLLWYELKKYGKIAYAIVVLTVNNFEMPFRLNLFLQSHIP